MSTNTIPSAVSGNVIPPEHHNSIKEALGLDLVPRGLDGVATALAGDLGSSTLPWLRLFFGAVASGLSIRETAGNNIGLYKGGLLVAEFDANGIKEVDTVNLSDNAVTTAKIADGNVTYAKRSNLNIVGSSSSGTYSTTSSTYVDVTNLSVSITTSGRPVMLFLFSNDLPSPGQLSGITPNTTASSAGNAKIQFYRVTGGGSSVAEYHLPSFSHTSPPNFLPLMAIETTATTATTYVYRVRAQVLRVTEMRLMAVEL